MFKRMYTVIVLVLLTIMLSLSPAFAGAGIPDSGIGQSSGFEAGTAQVVKLTGGLIYSATIYATSSNALLTIYDSNSSTNAVGSNIIYEVASATSGNSVNIEMSGRPLATYQGITVTVTNGYAFLNYQ